VHGVTGLARPAANEPFLDVLVDLARRKKVLTIGIGDGGNELGYGMIAEAVRQIHPHGERCQCPCEGGIVCETETDILVHGAVSNWAGYGVVACLAVMCHDPNLLHPPETEARILQACVDAGAEGGAGYRQPWVDNIPSDVHVAMVTMLHGIVDQALQESAGIARPW
jgi:hypothetical protein